MTQLRDQLTQDQNRALDTHTIRLQVVITPPFPGLFIATDRHGNQGAGRTARLAIESMRQRIRRSREIED